MELTERWFVMHLFGQLMKLSIHGKERRVLPVFLSFPGQNVLIKCQKWETIKTVLSGN